MSNDLDSLLAEGVISEVVARLKSGKEADVYVVRYQEREVAAKVYKDRSTRSFKNNAAYKEGRSVRNSRSQRAIDKGSKFGREAEEDAWKSAEVDAIYRLHGAGVRVPAPVLYFDGVLLMELVRDGEGAAARRVIDVPLSVEDARAAYEDMLRQLVRILSCDLIHGDLSPYNVLWGANGPTIIDFPQIISASHNQASEQFFLRDARNILGHFAQIDRSLNARSGDPFEIWRTYRRRELTPDFVPRARPMSMQRPIPIPRQAHDDDRRGPPRQEHGPRRDGDHAPQQQGRPGFAPRGRPQDRPLNAPGRGGNGPNARGARGPSPNGPSPNGGGRGFGGQAGGHRGAPPHDGQGGQGQHGANQGPHGQRNGGNQNRSGDGRQDRSRGGDDRARSFGSKRAAPVPEVIVRRAPASSSIDRDVPPEARLPEQREAEAVPAQPAPRRRRFPG